MTYQPPHFQGQLHEEPRLRLIPSPLSRPGNQRQRERAFPQRRKRPRGPLFPALRLIPLTAPGMAAAGRGRIRDICRGNRELQKRMKAVFRAISFVVSWSMESVEFV